MIQTFKYMFAHISVIILKQHTLSVHYASLFPILMQQ
jgi:hypothetical protein